MVPKKFETAAAANGFATVKLTLNVMAQVSCQQAFVRRRSAWLTARAEKRSAGADSDAPLTSFGPGAKLHFDRSVSNVDESNACCET
eukprot:scaffold492_cov257-Pinguiococcus_pyrenoidosus.AAC.31